MLYNNSYKTFCIKGQTILLSVWRVTSIVGTFCKILRFISVKSNREVSSLSNAPRKLNVEDYMQSSPVPRNMDVTIIGEIRKKQTWAVGMYHCFFDTSSPSLLPLFLTISRYEHGIIPRALQERCALPDDTIDVQAIGVVFPCRAYVPRMPANSRDAVKFRNSKQNRAPTIDFRKPYITSHWSHWLHP